MFSPLKPVSLPYLPPSPPSFSSLLLLPPSPPFLSLSLCLSVSLSSQTVDGHLQFRYHLGSGEAVVQQNTEIVNDGQFHSVSVRRTEQSAELVVDGRYINRTTSPGEETTLDIRPGAIYLGAAVDSQGSTSEGFIGCIQGAKLDRKDLPIGGESADFVSTVTSGVEFGCQELTESPQPAGYVYGALAAALFALFLMSTLFVIICVITRRVYEKRKKHTFHTNRRGGTSTSIESAGWHPSTFKPSVSLPHGMYRSTPQMGDTEQEHFERVNIHNLTNGVHSFPPGSSSPSVPATPAFTETSFTFTGNNSAITPTHRAANPQQENPRRVRNPAFPKQSTSNVRDENARVHHTRSPSGAPSMLTDKSEQDDVEVAKYLRKRIREVNHELEDRDYDEMIPYKDEGQFEPLGSIGSLYDILAEADGEHSVLGSPRKQISPTRPSPFTRSPPKHRSPHKVRPPPTEPPPPKLRSSHKLQPPPTEPPPPYQNLSVYNQPMSGLAPVHSRDHSKSSIDEPHRGDYNRKLDRLFEHFHTMTTDFSSELYQDHDIVQKRLI